VSLGLALARSLQSEPVYLSSLVRVSITEIQIQPVWEGLAKHRWKDAQLEELQKTLASFRPLEDYGRAMRGERAFNNQGLTDMRLGREAYQMDVPRPIRVIQRILSKLVSAMFYRNQLALDRASQEVLLPAVDATRHRVDPTKCTATAIASVMGKRTPYDFIAWMLLPAFESGSKRFARVQTDIDLAALACALERYHLAHEEYPEKLEALTPQFLAELPRDVFDGQPLKYRRTGQQFVLYSVGWNEKDDGGTVVMTGGKNPVPDPSKGDWVWRYPDTTSNLSSP
jgi:hypothetical protein